MVVVLAAQVVDIAGPDEAPAHLARDPHDLLVALVLLGEAVLLDLEVEVLRAEHRPQLICVRASVVAVDVSPDALTVARANARKHSLLAVSFVQSDWFDSLDPSLRGRIDLIVANPPYVGAEEFSILDPVLRFEPLGALVADDDRGVAGFRDVAHIIAASSAWLSDAGALIVEHGEGQGAAALSLARESGFADVEDHIDLAGHPRVLVARRG